MGPFLIFHQLLYFDKMTPFSPSGDYIIYVKPLSLTQWGKDTDKFFQKAKLEEKQILAILKIFEMRFCGKM